MNSNNLLHNFTFKVSNIKRILDVVDNFKVNNSNEISLNYNFTSITPGMINNEKYDSDSKIILPDMSNITNLFENFTNLSKIGINNNNSDSDKQGCELLGNFGFIIQGILGLLCFAVLIFKRFKENPKRTWKVWFFDSSKQLSSAGMAHIMNVIIAIFLSEKSDKGDSCVWYFINIFIDSTVGMIICCSFIYILNIIAEKYNYKVYF